LAVDEEFAFALASHLPPGLNGLRLSLKDLGRTLRAFTQSAPPVVALNDVNVAPVGHHGPPTCRS
jgi:hypothetical protein